MKLSLQGLEGIPQAAVARLEGDWQAINFEATEFVLQRAREGGCSYFIIDFSSARYVPDSMMSLIIRFLGSLQDEHGPAEDRVVLVPPRGPLFTGSAIFPAFPDLPSAMDYLRRHLGGSA